MSALEDVIAAVTALLVDYESPTTLRTWWAASPSTARAVHRHNDGTRMLLQRYPVVHGERLLAKVRTTREGVALHSSSTVGPAAAAVTHLRLLVRLYARDAAATLLVRLVSFDAQASQDVLAHWEHDPAEPPLRVEELETNRLLPLLSPAVRQQGRAPRPLEGLRSLGLMNTVAVDAALDGVRHLPALEHLDASGEAVQYLRALPLLLRLTYLDLSRTAVVNQDVVLLAALPALQHLDLHGCPGVHDVGLLRGARELRWLNARDCERLTRASRLGELPHLQFLDLSETHLGGAELAALLASPLPAARVLLQHTRFPREPLPPGVVVLPRIQYLNLKGVDFGLQAVDLLRRLGPVEELVLDGSTITAADLEALAPHWTSVRVLWLLRLDPLQLSCRFVLAMEELTILHIWRRTLKDQRDIAMLEERGVSVILHDH